MRPERVAPLPACASRGFPPGIPPLRIRRPQAHNLSVLENIGDLVTQSLLAGDSSRIAPVGSPGSFSSGAGGRILLLFSRRRSLGVYPGVDDFSAFAAEGAFLAFPPFPTKNRMQEVLLCQVVFRRKRGISAALSCPISFDMLARAIVSLKKTFSLSGEEEVPCLAYCFEGVLPRVQGLASPRRDHRKAADSLLHKIERGVT